MAQFKQCEECWETSNIKNFKSYNLCKYCFDRKKTKEIFKLDQNKFRKSLRKKYFRNISSRYNNKYNLTLKPLDFWKILKQQKMICPYSGIKLNRNNISLDHIIPLSTGGSNNISNFQFVHFNINLMKQSLSHNDFILLCNSVARNHILPNQDFTRLEKKIAVGLTKMHIKDEE